MSGRIALGLIFALAVAMTPALAQELRSRGGKGVWAWDGFTASTSFEAGFSLLVIFSPDHNCHQALFGIAGNGEISSIQFTVDQYGLYNPVDVEVGFLNDDLPWVGFWLSRDAIYDIKNGTVLRIDTNVGSVNASLEGSALAFNQAHGNCVAVLDSRTRQATPPKPVRQSAKVFAPSKEGKVASFDGDDGIPIVVFDGEFEDGDSQMVIDELRKTGADLLALNSPGGLVHEAQMVGYYVRSNSIDTMAGDLCASACAFALAGGVKRFAQESARIGLHRSQLPEGAGDVEVGQQVSANYIRYFQSMGVNPELVAIAGSAPSSGMRWLTISEAVRLDLITDVFSETE